MSPILFEVLLSTTIASVSVKCLSGKCLGLYDTYGHWQIQSVLVLRVRHCKNKSNLKCGVWVHGPDFIGMCEVCLFVWLFSLQALQMDLESKLGCL